MKTTSLALSLMAGVSFAGCAGSHYAQRMTAARESDGYDGAYRAFRLKELDCGGRSAKACCADLTKQLQDAQDKDMAGTVATTLDRVALLCPTDRAVAVRALDFQPRPFEHPDAALVKVSFGGALADTDRIYWASAFIDDRYPVMAGLEPGPRTLDVELHVLTTGDGAANALYKLHAHHEMVVGAKEIRSVAIVARRRAPGDPAGDSPGVPFVLEVHESKATAKTAAPGSGSASPVPPTPPAGNPEVPQLKRISAQIPVFPPELARDTPWFTFFKVCVDQQGTVSSISPITRPVHPRLLGLLLNSFLRAKYQPARFRGKAIPACAPVRFQLTQG